jgi:hypothetical protein
MHAHDNKPFQNNEIPKVRVKVEQSPYMFSGELTVPCSFIYCITCKFISFCGLRTLRESNLKQSNSSYPDHIY